MSSNIESHYVKGTCRPVAVYYVCGNKLIVEGRVVRIARLKDEYEADISDPEAITTGLRACGCEADLLTFWDRVPCSTRYPYLCQRETHALLPVQTYDHWWNEQIDRQMRKLVRRASKLGVEARVEEWNPELLRAIKNIFDQTPVKRNKPFWHYNRPLDQLRAELEQDLLNTEFIVARFCGEAIGFVKMIYRDKFADPVLFLSMPMHYDKLPNNLLMAKAVERCAAKGLPFIHYSAWRLGQHGDFLRRNAFEKFPVNRYFVPLNARGKIILLVGGHRHLWDLVPESLKMGLLRVRGSVHRLAIWLKSATCGEERSPRNAAS